MNATNRPVQRRFFKEEQHFGQLWIWGVLVAFTAFIGYELAYIKLAKGYIAWGLAVSLVVLVAIALVVGFMRLETEISNRGISFRWAPLQRSPKLIRWREIAQAKVEQYNAIHEFGGWGIRAGMKGLAHNVRGDMGIRISIKGRRHSILLGTQLPQEAQEVLENCISDPNIHEGENTAV